MNAYRTMLFAILVFAGVISRLVDHPWNLAPMGAIALFAGAHLRSRSLALCVPLIAMTLSDFGLGLIRNNLDFYTFHGETLVVYGCFMLYVALGMGIRFTWKKQDAGTPANGGASVAKRSLPILGGSLIGAILFFLITNFGTWAMFPTYSPTFAGLMECYAAGLPFFRNTLASDVVYASVLFGGYEILKSRYPGIERAGFAQVR